MITDAQRAELQRIAESRMRDTCRVTRLAGAPTAALDPETGLDVEVDPPIVWTGPCRLRTGGNIAGGASRLVAGDSVPVSTPVFAVPVSAPRLLVDDIVVIVAVPSDDPAGHLRKGLRLRVTGPVLQTDGTAQRLQVQVVN